MSNNFRKTAVLNIHSKEVHQHVLGAVPVLKFLHSLALSLSLFIKDDT